MRQEDLSVIDDEMPINNKMINNNNNSNNTPADVVQDLLD